MKKLLVTYILILVCSYSYSQQSKPLSNDKFNYVVGLPKMTVVQLELIKNDLLQFSQLVSAEFVFKDYCLLIETDPQAPKILAYAEIEKVLLNYFQAVDIYRKSTLSFIDLKASNSKNDKFIIK